MNAHDIDLELRDLRQSIDGVDSATRLKEEEDEILKQLHLLHEHVGRWEAPT